MNPKLLKQPVPLMLVTQCPRCHESVRVPDAMLAGGGPSQPASVQAKCPWCLETLDSRELSAALPPALMLVGEAATLGTGIGTTAADSGDDWGSDDWVHPTEHNVSRISTEPIDSPAQGQTTPATGVFHDAGLLYDPSVSGEPESAELDDLGELDRNDESDLIETAALSQQETDAEDDGSEFMLKEPASAVSMESKSAKTKSPEIMMDTENRRRKRGGSPVKTIIGVAAGGLLALPIVGVILHFATGQHVPFISDILPAVGQSKPTLRASSPRELDSNGILIGEGDIVSGRSIGDELEESTSNEAMSDPADAALSAIRGNDSDAMPTLDFGVLPETDSVATNPLDSETNSGDVASMSAPAAGADEQDLFSDSAAVDMSAAIAEVATPEIPDMTPDLGTDLFSGAASTPAEPQPAQEQPAPEPVVTEAPVNAVDTDAELQRFNTSLVALNAMAASAPERAEAVQKLYESLAQLASDVPPGSISKLQPALKDLSSNMGLVVAIAKASPDWIARSREDRGSDGAVVVGKLSGDTPETATIRLSNHQEVPVTLPDSVTKVPSGIQIGLGRVTGSGREATLALELLQPVSP